MRIRTIKENRLASFSGTEKHLKKPAIPHKVPGGTGTTRRIIAATTATTRMNKRHRFLVHTIDDIKTLGKLAIVDARAKNQREVEVTHVSTDQGRENLKRNVSYRLDRRSAEYLDTHSVTTTTQRPER